MDGPGESHYSLLCSDEGLAEFAVRGIHAVVDRAEVRIVGHVHFARWS